MGPADLASDVESTLEEAGYEIARELGGGPSERSSLEDMRAYGRMGALYLDTHGAAYQPIEIVRDDEGELTGLEGEALRYGCQTSLLVTGSVTVRQGGTEFEQAVIITPPGLEFRNALGCTEITLNDDLSVSSGSVSETGLYTLEWTAFEPTSVPDADTPD